MYGLQVTRLTSPPALPAGCVIGSAFGKSSRGSSRAEPDGFSFAVVELFGLTFMPHGSAEPARNARASASASTYRHSCHAASERPCGTRRSEMEGATIAWYFQSGLSALTARKSGSNRRLRGLAPSSAWSA